MYSHNKSIQGLIVHFLGSEEGDACVYVAYPFLQVGSTPPSLLVALGGASQPPRRACMQASTACRTFKLQEHQYARQQPCPLNWNPPTSSQSSHWELSKLPVKPLPFSSFPMPFPQITKPINQTWVDRITGEGTGRYPSITINTNFCSTTQFPLKRPLCYYNINILTYTYQ